MNRYERVLAALGVEATPMTSQLGKWIVKWPTWQLSVSDNAWQLGHPPLDGIAFVSQRTRAVVWLDREEAVDACIGWGRVRGIQIHFTNSQVYYDGRMVGHLNHRESMILDGEELETFTRILAMKNGIVPGSDDWEGVSHTGSLMESDSELLRAHAIISSFDRTFVDSKGRFKVANTSCITSAKHEEYGKSLIEVVRRNRPLLVMSDELDPVSVSYWFRDGDEFHQACDDLLEEYPGFETREVNGTFYVKNDMGENVFYLTPTTGPVQLDPVSAIEYARALTKRFDIGRDEEDGLVAGSVLVERQVDPIPFLRGLGVKVSDAGEELWDVHYPLYFLQITHVSTDDMGNMKSDQTWVNDFRQALGNRLLGMELGKDGTDYTTFVYLNHEDVSHDIEVWLKFGKKVKTKSTSGLRVFDRVFGNRVASVDFYSTWTLSMPELQWLADRLAHGTGDDETHGIETIGHIMEEEDPVKRAMSVVSDRDELEWARRIVFSLDKRVSYKDGKFSMSGVHYITNAMSRKWREVLRRAVERRDPLLVTSTDDGTETVKFWFRNREEMEAVIQDIEIEYPELKTTKLVSNHKYLINPKGNDVFFTWFDMSSISLNSEDIVKYARNLVKRFDIGSEEEEGLAASSTLLEERCKGFLEWVSAQEGNRRD